MVSWLISDAALLDSSCPLPLDKPFTAHQALGLGVSRKTLRWLVIQGLVRRVTHGVYAVAQAPNTIELRAEALRLVIPPSAVVTDRTAGWLLGLDLLSRSLQSKEPPLSIFLTPGNRVKRAGVDSGERRLLPRDIMVVHGVRVTTPLRTACDLGRLLWRFDALAALDQFLRLGVDHEELLVEIERFKGYRGVVQLRALAALADARAESVAESALRLHWYEAALPKPEPQWWVFDDAGVGRYRLDLALPEVRYGAEYNGEEHHSTPADQERDAERLEWLTETRGWHIEVFTKADLFVPKADPGPRLRRGLVIARQALATPISYPTLAQQAMERVRPPEQR